jgi:hypothetical protein
MLRCIFEKRPEGVLFASLALILLLLPPFIKKSFRVELPTLLEAVAYFFVFCAQILGEINSFYTKVPYWDTMLHTVCGFIFAAFGFCLFDIFNKNRKSKFELSPFFLTLLAFCFSITIGTVWEFFEFGMDALTLGDMQRDTVVSGFGSTFLNPDRLNSVIYVEEIEKTLIYTKNGVIEINGYLDIGLIDTIKDMFVNFIGAFIFSIFGYTYIKTRGKGKVAAQFIPVFKGDRIQEDAQNDQIIAPVTDENTEKEAELT